jgi:hypothetical protein
MISGKIRSSVADGRQAEMATTVHQQVAEGVAENGSSDTKRSFAHSRKTAGRGEKLTESRRTETTTSGHVSDSN